MKKKDLLKLLKKNRGNLGKSKKGSIMLRFDQFLPKLSGKDHYFGD